MLEDEDVVTGGSLPVSAAVADAVGGSSSSGSESGGDASGESDRAKRAKPKHREKPGKQTTAQAHAIQPQVASRVREHSTPGLVVSGTLHPQDARRLSHPRGLEGNRPDRYSRQANPRFTRSEASAAIERFTALYGDTAPPRRRPQTPASRPLSASNHGRSLDLQKGPRAALARMKSAEFGLERSKSSTETVSRLHLGRTGTIIIKESASATVKWSKGHGGGLHVSLNKGQVSIADGRFSFSDNAGLHHFSRGLRENVGEAWRLAIQRRPEKLRGGTAELSGTVGRTNEHVFGRNLELEAAVKLTKAGPALEETASTSFETKPTRAGKASVTYSITTSVSFEKAPSLKIPIDVIEVLLVAGAVKNVSTAVLRQLIRLLRGQEGDPRESGGPIAA